MIYFTIIVFQLDIIIFSYIKHCKSQPIDENFEYFHSEKLQLPAGFEFHVLHRLKTFYRKLVMYFAI